MSFEFNSKEAGKIYADQWVSLHSAPVDGERDAKKLGSIGIIKDITPRQKEYLASFNNAAAHINEQFSRKEEKLHNLLQEKKYQFDFVKPEYERLRKKVGGRDFEIFFKPSALFIICIFALICLSILNTCFLDKFIDNSTLLKIVFGIILAALAIGIGYLAGMVTRQAGVKSVLVYFTGIVFLLYCSILLLFLHSYHYEPVQSMLVIFNIMIILIITISTYLAHDKELNYPKVQKKYEVLGKKIEQITNDRAENLSICREAQEQLKSAAEEMDKKYMKNCDPTGKLALKHIKFEIRPLKLNDEIISSSISGNKVIQLQQDI